VDAAASLPAGPFEELTEASGFRFDHFNGMSGEFFFHEMMGAGAGLVDFDRDGDLDLYLVQGHMLGAGKSLRDALLPPSDAPPFRDRLFRNDLEIHADGQRSLRFVDVTAASGLDARGYGMGVAVGDVDGDGWPDLYTTNFRENQLWRNRGDGTFEDATAAAGVGDRRWSVPAVFWDYDRDGDLDLYVGNYVDFSEATQKRCTTELGGPNYCGPLSFEPQEDALYRNRGDGTFEDVTGRAGLRSAPAGGALGAVAGDFNGDGWPDLYVANDGVPNHLWINHGDGTFSNEALLAGAAVNRNGQPEGSMGLDAGDIDGDGDEDLFMTHLQRETNTLYRNAGDGTFEDAAVSSGLAAPSREFTGFGTAFLDYDGDGAPDLVAVNGAVKVVEELALAGDPYPLHQRNQLFHNRGDGTFEEVEGGEPFARSEVSRGAAVGDLNNDGAPDLLLTNNAGPARLLIHRQAPTWAWLGLRLVEGKGRDALGAWARVTVDGRKPLWRRVRSAAGYASAQDPRILLGLGDSSAATARVEVQWPDDDGPRQEVFPAVPLGAYSTLVRGQGSAGTSARTSATGKP
jgi:hypothetical protein